MSGRRPDRFRRVLKRAASADARSRSAAGWILSLAIVFGVFALLPEWATSYAQGLAVLMLLVGVWVFWLRTRLVYKKLERLNFEACLNCEYPLKGLPPKHRCPECGNPYEIEVVRGTWKNTLRWARQQHHRFPPGHCAFCGYSLTGPAVEVAGSPFENGQHFCIGCKNWHEHRFPPGHCQVCGHNLTGKKSGVCPECATPAVTSHDRVDSN